MEMTLDLCFSTCLEHLTVKFLSLVPLISSSSLVLYAVYFMPSRLCRAAVRHWCHHLRVNRCKEMGWHAIQLYSWADTATLLNLYLTCVHSHLEYARTSPWDPYTYKNIFMLESVQKFACKVRLKWWELDCGSMLHLLGITRLSTCRQSLKLVTLVQSS